jgi:chromate reductase, NAD(P)H dehydrogenase (quinone)
MSEIDWTAAEVRVLGIAGSSRAGSYNRRLLEAAGAASPDGLTLSVYEDLAAIPFYDEDLEAGGTPDAVRRLREQVAAADALLIATPEYNGSFPGVLKNAIDWISRRAPDRLLAGKPVAVIGASSGPWGTRQAQVGIRQVLLATEAAVLPGPAVYVRDAAQQLPADGAVSDATAAQLQRLMAAFAGWIEQLSSIRQVSS